MEASLKFLVSLAYFLRHERAEGDVREESEIKTVFGYVKFEISVRHAKL